MPEGPTWRRTINIDGLEFRDLDHDGVLAPYEDYRHEPAVRVADLLSRMTLAEKVGLMMHGTAQSDGPLGSLGVGSHYNLVSAREQILSKSINHLLTRLNLAPDEFARGNNQLQAIAAESRLGIPVTVSTDPRHHFQHVTGASSRAIGFSQWPETTGLAATGQPELVRRFGEVANAEYRAVGIQMALSPQADIASEPRWSRISGTFGEFPDLARAMVAAYVQGMQGSSTGPTATGTATVVKHWVGYGAAPEGFDGHNSYGRYSAVTDDSLHYHIEPFLDAFELGAAGVMPTYTILHLLTENGQPVEPVAGGFSHYLLTTLLRQKYGFAGFILSDWAIYRDATPATVNPQQMQSPDDIAMPWGVEGLSRIERIAQSVNAGVDQLGGEEDVQALLSAVTSGLVSNARIDEAAGRLLKVKFELGLFDAPFVDEQEALEVVGCETHQQLALDAQRQALVCLVDHEAVDPPDNVLDLKDIDEAIEDSTLVIRIASPAELLHPHHFFGSRQQEGSLAYKESSEELRKLTMLSKSNRLILVVQMARPAIISNLLSITDGLYVDLGVSDEVILEAVSGSFKPTGRLPFNIPESMESVLQGDPALPGHPQPLEDASGREQS